MGHINIYYLQRLQKQCPNVRIVPGSTTGDCAPCALGKLARAPFYAVEERAKYLLELVHSDVCHVVPPPMGQHKYFITFLDDFSRMNFIYHFKKKSEVHKCFSHFINLM